eukprot:4281360-Prymnesium_polylepis.2
MISAPTCSTAFCAFTLRPLTTSCSLSMSPGAIVSTSCLLSLEATRTSAYAACCQPEPATSSVEINNLPALCAAPPPCAEPSASCGPAADASSSAPNPSSAFTRSSSLRICPSEPRSRRVIDLSPDNLASLFARPTLTRGATLDVRRSLSDSAINDSARPRFLLPLFRSCLGCLFASFVRS